jgi:hypothetical protein
VAYRSSPGAPCLRVSKSVSRCAFFDRLHANEFVLQTSWRQEQSCAVDESHYQRPFDNARAPCMATSGLTAHRAGYRVACRRPPDCPRSAGAPCMATSGLTAHRAGYRVACRRPPDCPRSVTLRIGRSEALRRVAGQLRSVVSAGFDVRVRPLVSRHCPIQAGACRQCVAWSCRDCTIRKQRPGCGLNAAMRSPGSAIGLTERR